MGTFYGQQLHLYILNSLNTRKYLKLSVHTFSTILSDFRRARNIKNKPTVQVDPQEKLIWDLRAEIKLLRMENDMLRRSLNGEAVPSREVRGLFEILNYLGLDEFSYRSKT